MSLWWPRSYNHNYTFRDTRVPRSGTPVVAEHLETADSPPFIGYHETMSAVPDLTPDRVRTVSGLTTASILILGSKFHTALAPAENETEAETLLHLRERRYPDASHHCWAMRVGRPDTLLERSADAGEPSGTAGRPILDALRGAQLENIVCVVSRYFGGTKLGTGGLVRAYADAANAAIGETTCISRIVVRFVALDFDHERTGIVYRALDEFGVQFQKGHYDERAHGHVDVPVSLAEPLRARIRELARTGVDWTEGELTLR